MIVKYTNYFHPNQTRYLNIKIYLFLFNINILYYRQQIYNVVNQDDSIDVLNQKLKIDI